jgi:hypothetical protein
MVSGKQDLPYTLEPNWLDKKDEDDCSICTPCCADMLAEIWQRERNECQNGELVSSTLSGCESRWVHLLGAIGDIAMCTFGCPVVCTACSLFSCCSITQSGVFYCSEKCCFEGKAGENVHASVVETANEAKECFTGGFYFSVALLGIGVKAVACCPVNVISPAAADAWCFQQECNYTLYKMTRWSVCGKETEEPPPAQRPEV